MDKSAIFSVANHHVEGCGKPPHIDDVTSNRYLGYFENAHGEQALFLYDGTSKEGTLSLGDAGWERPRKVVGGTVPGLILGAEEREWLMACWKAAVGR